MGFSSPQPSLSPHAQILLNWICFSQKWWLLSHLATAEGDSGAFGKKAASPWQLWQGHRGTSGGHVGPKVVGCCFPSGLFEGHRNSVPMSVQRVCEWVRWVTACGVLLLGFFWKDKEKQDCSSWSWTWNKLFLTHLVQIFGCEQSLCEIKPTNFYFFNVRKYQSKPLRLPYLDIKQ